MEVSQTGLLPETLRIGLPEIDGQHEAIFGQLEALKVSCFGTSELPAAEFQLLIDAVAHHFATEERIAEQSGIEFSKHTKVHRDNLLSMRDTLDVVLSGVSEPYSFLRFVEFWFERHIVQYDQPFAESIQRMDHKASAPNMVGG